MAGVLHSLLLVLMVLTAGYWFADWTKIKGYQIEAGDGNDYITCSRCCLIARPAVSNCWNNNAFSVTCMDMLLLCKRELPWLHIKGNT